MKVIFNCPMRTGSEVDFIKKYLMKTTASLCEREFTKLSEVFLERRFDYKKVLLTSSCTAALEICALLIRDGIKNNTGDPEIIMSSFTFVSTANAFAKFGYKIIFVDINPITMNIDENCVEKAITKNTRAVVAVNYGGISADLNKLRKMCDQHGIYLIEDAAQSYDSYYQKKTLGTFGDLAALSFHETKNITSGEGGCLVINNDKFIDHATIAREKGTNRLKYYEGQVKEYSWVEIGGHYLMSEINAAVLLCQLEKSDEIKSKRLSLWDQYDRELKPLKNDGLIEMQTIPANYDQNAHMFWIKVKNADERHEFIKKINQNDVGVTFHYVPLHTSLMGKKYGVFCGEDRNTTRESGRLVRLPLYTSLTDEELEYVVKCIRGYFYA